MKFTVVWTDSAASELAAIWNASTDRAEVSNAANSLDASLANDPSSVGESRGGRTRIAIRAPLAILFDCDDDGRIVTVWDLWRWSG